MGSNRVTKAAASLSCISQNAAKPDKFAPAFSATSNSKTWSRTGVMAKFAATETPPVAKGRERRTSGALYPVVVW